MVLQISFSPLMWTRSKGGAFRYSNSRDGKDTISNTDGRRCWFLLTTTVSPWQQRQNDRWIIFTLSYYWYQGSDSYVNLYFHMEYRIAIMHIKSRKILNCIEASSNILWHHAIIRWPWTFSQVSGHEVSTERTELRNEPRTSSPRLECNNFKVFIVKSYFRCHFYFSIYSIGWRWVASSLTYHDEIKARRASLIGMLFHN